MYVFKNSLTIQNHDMDLVLLNSNGREREISLGIR